MARYRHENCGGSWSLHDLGLRCDRCGATRGVHPSMQPAVKFGNSEAADARDAIVFHESESPEAILARITACIEEYRTRGSGLVPIVTLDRVIKGET